MRYVLGVVAIIVGSSCVSITTKTTFTEELVTRRSRIETIDDSTRYFATSTLDGESLALTLTSEERCKTIVTPIFHKIAHHVRAVASGPTEALQPKYMVLYGLGLAGLGTLSYADANGLAANNAMGDMDSGSTSTPGDYQTTGIMLASVGAALLAVAAIDGLRLRDSDEDMGTWKSAPEVSDDACHNHLITDAKVALGVAGDDWSVQAITDDEGVLRVGLRELPEAAFRGSRLDLSVAVAGATAKVALTEDATAALLTTLGADSQSRVARDRDTRRAATCQQQIIAVRAFVVTPDTGPLELQRTTQEWAQARTTCGDKWQPEYETASAAFQAAITATALQRATKACDEATQRAMAALDDAQDAQIAQDDDGDRPEVSQATDAVRDRCTDSPNAASAVKRVEDRVKKLETDRAHAAKREAARAAMNERLQANDAVGLAAVIARDGDARGVLMGSPRAAALMIDLAKAWIGRVGHDGSSAVIRQLCASRTLVRTVAGDAEWMTLRRNAVEHSDVVAGSQVARAMDGCK